MKKLLLATPLRGHSFALTMNRAPAEIGSTSAAGSPKQPVCAPDTGLNHAGGDRRTKSTAETSGAVGSGHVEAADGPEIKRGELAMSGGDAGHGHVDGEDSSAAGHIGKS